MFFLFIVKAIIILILLALGVLLLVKGMGVEIDYLKYGKVEAYGIPAGVVLIVAAIAVAYFWRISVKHVEWKSSGGTLPDEGNSDDAGTVESKKESEYKFKGPLDS